MYIAAMKLRLSKLDQENLLTIENLGDKKFKVRSQGLNDFHKC